MFGLCLLATDVRNLSVLRSSGVCLSLLASLRSLCPKSRRMVELSLQLCVFLCADETTQDQLGSEGVAQEVLLTCVIYLQHPQTVSCCCCLIIYNYVSIITMSLSVVVI